MSDPMHEGADAARARSRRNMALALGLIAFVIVTFVVTLVRLGSHVFDPHY